MITHRKWPSDCVLHHARVVLLRGDLPQLLDPDPVDLTLVSGVEIELVHQLLGQLTPTSLAEDGALCVELHPPFEAVLGRAVLAYSHVVGGDALHIQ